MTEAYYAATAYDGSRLKGITRKDNSKFSFTTRQLRKHPLRRFPTAQCAEFLSMDQVHIIELLNSEEQDVRKELAAPGHEFQPWETFRNPKILVETIAGAMYFLAIPAWLGFLMVTIIILFKHPWWLIEPEYLAVIMIPTILTALSLIGKRLIALGNIQDKYNIILNRRKGTILCPRKNNPNQEISFVEFDPYYNISAESSGRIGYHLCLCHRYSEEWISCPGEQEDEWGVYQLWEYWQRYMDVSKPLPDTPKMEAYRSRDPVTAAYDKEHNRPPDYWKNMDIKTAYKMQAASIKASSNYSWGEYRRHALASGWRPSRFGEGDWLVERDHGQELRQAKDA